MSTTTSSRQPKRTLWTVGDIARELGIPEHSVDYAIRKYHIGESQRAGILRLYDADGFDAVRMALRRIERRGNL